MWRVANDDVMAPQRRAASRAGTGGAAKVGGAPGLGAHRRAKGGDACGREGADTLGRGVAEHGARSGSAGRRKRKEASAARLEK